MIRKTRLFTPGPTPLLPAAQFAMAAADMHHRTPSSAPSSKRSSPSSRSSSAPKRCPPALQFRHRRHGSLRFQNLTSPGDRVLVLTAGKFGERWTGLAKAFGCEPDVVTPHPTARPSTSTPVEDALKPEHRAVFMQATETSTAVRHDVEAIAKLLREVAPEAFLIVDGITGLGTTHFDVDGWGIDILIGGSQKAVMIPPGLAYLSVSDRAWAAMETSKIPATTSISAKNAKTPPRAKAPTRLRSLSSPASAPRSTTSPGRQVAIWRKAELLSSTTHRSTLPPPAPDSSLLASHCSRRRPQQLPQQR